MLDRRQSERPHVHVVGAGLAGLAAALRLVDAGAAVTLHESAAHAGGRCRSYFDKTLGHRIDNGNHLLLSGNESAFAYLDRIKALDTLTGPAQPLFPFIDRGTGERWTLRLSPGRIPWWMFSAERRVPGTTVGDYLALSRLLRAGPDATVGQTVRTGALFNRLIAPLTISGLNTAPDEGSAALFAAIVRQTLLRGGEYCLPRWPATGLSESFVDPAVAALTAAGATLRFGHRIQALQVENGRVAALLSAEGSLPLAPGDGVVLAVPAPVAGELLPGLVVPNEFRAILNIHFKQDTTMAAGFAGVIGGVAEWVFAKPGIVSVTISAADARVDQPAEAIAAAVWSDVVAACGISPAALRDPLPAWRVIKEKRATFAATPAQQRRRPPTRTAINNLMLAGDWTNTGLPATIEGAIRSGCSAAAALLEREYHA